MKSLTEIFYLKDDTHKYILIGIVIFILFILYKNF
jgi:hypothetical protein